MAEHMHTEDTSIFADIRLLKGIFDDGITGCMACQRIKACQSPYEKVIIVDLRSLFVKVSCNGISYCQCKGDIYKITCL